MSRREALSLASRTLALLLLVWALTEVSHLPATLYGFLRYTNEQSMASARIYWQHQYLIELGFRITRIIGYSLTSVWLFKGGPDVEELLLPATEEHSVITGVPTNCPSVQFPNAQRHRMPRPAQDL